MLQILISVIYGIVEGITEWLPISSTGHLILLKDLINLNVSKEFWDMYLVVIQLGAILAVVILFWNRIWPFTTKEKGIIKKDIFMMWVKIIPACIPAGVVGIAFGDEFDKLFYHRVPIAIALIVVGIIFIIVENMEKGKRAKINSISEITFAVAFYIGVFQMFAAIFPGTSRSGATIIGGLLLGCSRVVAAEFTFYLAIPAMFGASVIKMMKFGFHYTGQEAAILIVGMLVSLFVSLVVIRFLMSYIKKHDFKIFGWYRIVLGIIVLAVAFFIH